MTVRARYKVEMNLSSSPAEEKDLANLKYEVYTDDMGEGATIKMVLAANSSDIEIPLGVVASAKFLMVRTNSKDQTQGAQEITLKRNSNAAEAIAVTPMGGKEGFLMLTTNGLTGLYASNASSVPMELTIVVTGD